MTRLVVALAAALTAPPARPAVTRDFRVPVLMYHRVATLTPAQTRNALLRDLTVPPAHFEQQVRFLVSHGFVFLTAQDVAQAVRTHAALPARAVAITFDDGYRNNYTEALPILLKYHATATIFLVSSTVGTPRHLTWPEIGDMQRDGIRFGSHTVHHVDLAGLPVRVMDRELRDSRQVLAALLRQPVDTIAYPSGSFNDTVIARVRAAGYTSAWRKAGGPVTVAAMPYRLPRVRVNGRIALRGFAALVEHASLARGHTRGMMARRTRRP